MKILPAVLVLTGLGLALLLVTRTFKIPHQAYYDDRDTHVFTKGNASPRVRHEIEQKLLHFQEGYMARDTSVLAMLLLWSLVLLSSLRLVYLLISWLIHRNRI